MNQLNYGKWGKCDKLVANWRVSYTMVIDNAVCRNVNINIAPNSSLS
jgi:hypothetical protein